MMVRSDPGQSGFTLIEVMIVVFLIALLASLAYPYTLEARRQANDGNAIQELRTISTMQQLYGQREMSTTGLPFATNLNELAAVELSNVGQFSSRHGFIFYVVPITEAGVVTGWIANADPQSPGKTGNFFYGIDHVGVIRRTTAPSFGTGDPVGQ